MHKVIAAITGLAFATSFAVGAAADTAPPASPRAVRYLLSFDGTATPDKAGKHLTANETATLPADFDSAVSAGTKNVTINTLVTLGAKGTFTEKGTITFGGGTVLIQTAAPGHIGPSKIPGMNSGYVIWKVVGGTGVFVGATGYILSRFSETNGVILDGESAIIYIK